MHVCRVRFSPTLVMFVRSLAQQLLQDYDIEFFALAQAQYEEQAHGT